jgi:exodeoxyribonuclease VII small subunit
MTKKIKDISGLSYEQAQEELQALLAQIEAQSIPLDALLAAYQRCQELLAHCRGKLNALEVQMQRIDGGAGAGKPSTAASDDDESDIPF